MADTTIKFSDGSVSVPVKAIDNGDGSYSLSTAGSGTGVGSVVVGNVASGVADAGNPVKVGGKYNSPAPVLVAGQRGDLQVDINGNLMVTLATAIYGEDNINNILAVQQAALSTSTYAWSVAQSGALEASRIVKASPGNLRSVTARIDSTAASGTYYIQFMDSATLPADGAVTHLFPPIKKIHVSGVDDYISVDFTPNCIHAAAGIVIDLSTTEFTKTIAGALMSVGVLYK